MNHTDGVIDGIEIDRILRRASRANVWGSMLTGKLPISVCLPFKFRLIWFAVWKGACVGVSLPSYPRQLDQRGNGTADRRASDTLA